MYQNRSYRNLAHRKNLTSFKIVVKETDLLVHADRELEQLAKKLILESRGYIEAYIRQYPHFSETLEPFTINRTVSGIVKDMVKASAMARVGPMAAVAGAIAGYGGKGLLSNSGEVVVENGGDVFLKVNGPFIVGIFAGGSPLSMRTGLRLESKNSPISVCTSSGTVGHSLSFGKADAVCVVSKSCPLADAAATSICNLVKSKKDIQNAVEFGKSIKGVDGVVVIKDKNVGMWGPELEIIPL